MTLCLDKILSTLLSPLLSFALYSPPSRRASLCVISHSRHLGIRRRLTLQIVKFCSESQALLIEYWDCEGDLKEAIVITLSSCAFPRLRKGEKKERMERGSEGKKGRERRTYTTKYPTTTAALHALPQYLWPAFPISRQMMRTIESPTSKYVDTLKLFLLLLIWTCKYSSSAPHSSESCLREQPISHYS